MRGRAPEPGEPAPRAARHGEPPPAGLLVAVVQSAPVLGDVPRNLATTLDAAERASDQGASLVVFAECSLTGYMLTRGEAFGVAQSVPGQATRDLAGAARRLGLTLVVGMVVADGGRLYNTAVLVGADGSVRQYRKAHLPRLGVDNYCAPGDTGLAPFRTPVGRLGLLICYDLRFPEAARVLALNGADLLVVIANFPRDASDYADVLTRARAGENRIPAVIADRAGRERGVDYLGRSQGLLPDGTVFAEAGEGEEMLLVRFDAGLVSARRGLATGADGPAGLLADRRPELYGRLTDRRPAPVEREST